MSKLTIEFELSEDAAILADGKISVDLGSGVHFQAKAPKGLERINSIVLQLVMDVEGNIAKPIKTPIERVHETQESIDDKPSQGATEESTVSKQNTFDKGPTRLDLLL